MHGDDASFTIRNAWLLIRLGVGSNIASSYGCNACSIYPPTTMHLTVSPGEFASRSIKLARTMTGVCFRA